MSRLVNHIRNLLGVAEIAVRLKKEYIGGGAGELPPTEAWPELWVKERDFPAAQTLVDEFFYSSADTPPDWLCPACGEASKGNSAIAGAVAGKNRTISQRTLSARLLTIPSSGVFLPV